MRCMLYHYHGKREEEVGESYAGQLGGCDDDDATADQGCSGIESGQIRIEILG